MNKKWLKVILCVLAGYFVLAGAYYLLAGEQLHIRTSRGMIVRPPATSGTLELTAENVVEQDFSLQIQKLSSISVQWGTFNRPNTGDVIVELIRQDTGKLVLSETVPAETLTEGGITTLTFETPSEDYYDIPLRLKLYAPDGVLGTAVIPLMSEEVSGTTSLDTFSEHAQLYFNGEPADGMLCVEALGEDFIWIGLHYWEFVLVGGLLLLVWFVFMAIQQKKGKEPLLLKGLFAIHKYNFLIQQLVSRDFKAKYKRSVLGVFWSFLNPLLTMAVQFVVFSEVFRFDIEYFPVYLLSGIVMFNFFSEVGTMSLTSIVGNASLITKVYVPKYVYPLTRSMSSFINLLISLIPLLGATLIAGLMPTKAWLLLPYPLLCITIFSLGLGLMLATAMVFFRDAQFLWGVMTMIWMYLTPIFYPASILPDWISWILHYNPVYIYIDFVRTLLISGISPEPIVYVQSIMIALVTLLVGLVVFKKNQDKFVLYI